MKYLSFAFLFPLLGCVAAAQGISLPDSWSDDLVITTYQGGGMRYQSVEVICTAERCVYDLMDQGIHTIHEARLSAQDKETILRQLHANGLNRAYSLPQSSIAHDKETTRICLTSKAAKHCVESSASRFVGFNSDGFFHSYEYLVDFAMKKEAPTR